MAWTIPTYAGTRATGSPSNYRIAMYELCRAISERNTLIGGGAITFYKADGTTTAVPTMADLLNMPCSGPSCLAYQNMALIAGYIRSMCSLFTTTLGGNTAYTQISLQTAIGRSFDVPPTKPNEALWWQAMQDALDLLTFTRGEVQKESGPSYVSTAADSSPLLVSFSDAYDDRYFQSSSPSAFGIDLEVAVFNQYAGKWLSYETSQTTRIYNSRYIYMGGSGSPVPNAPTGGDCVKTVIEYETAEDYLADPISFTVDGEAAVLSTSGTASVEIDPFVINSNNTVIYDMTTPVSHPFTAPTGGDVDTRFASVEGGNAIMWIDLTPYLTDQA